MDLLAPLDRHQPARCGLPGRRSRLAACPRRQHRCPGTDPRHRSRAAQTAPRHRHPLAPPRQGAPRRMDPLETPPPISRPPGPPALARIRRRTAAAITNYNCRNRAFSICSELAVHHPIEGRRSLGGGSSGSLPQDSRPTARQAGLGMEHRRLASADHQLRGAKRPWPGTRDVQELRTLPEAASHAELAPVRREAEAQVAVAGDVGARERVIWVLDCTIPASSLRTPIRQGGSDFLPERWKRLHGDRWQGRGSMGEFSGMCIAMHGAAFRRLRARERVAGVSGRRVLRHRRRRRFRSPGCGSR